MENVEGRATTLAQATLGHACFLATVLAVATCGAGRSADRDALLPLQGMIGQWRGVGQPRRGSNAGAWKEDCSWSWKFRGGSAVFQFEATAAKYFSRGELRSLETPGQFEFLVTAADEAQPLRYVGERGDNGRLVLKMDQPKEGYPARISIRQVAGGDRLLVLYERRTSTDRFLRLAEVGYTRQGSGFGKGTNFVECIVSGGVGTMPVTFDGTTYYVCCSGCRDYFNEDPAAVLADYRERKAAEKATQP